MSDTKEEIAQAAMSYIMEGNIKKMTVTGIVKRCGITRQTFYYHFNDIPDMLMWTIQHSLESKGDPVQTDFTEESFSETFNLFLSMLPYFKKFKQTSYDAELSYLAREYLYSVAYRSIEANNLYPTLSREEKNIVIRYNIYAAIGMLENWSDKDEKNKTQVIHIIYQQIIGQMTP